MAQRQFIFSSVVTLTAGTKYGILITRKTMSGSANFTASGTAGSGVLVNAGKVLVDTYIRAPVNTVTVGQSYTSGSNSYWFALLVEVSTGSGGGGGGSNLEVPIVKPTAAQFTLQNAGTAVVSDEPYGMKLLAPASASQIRFLKYNAALPATWKITMRSAPIVPFYGGAYPCSLIARVSGAGGGVAGRILISGLFNTSQILTQRWNNYGSFNANVLGATGINPLSAVWSRLEKTATSLIFSVSPNGEDFYVLSTELISTFMTGVDEFGIGVMANGGAGDTMFQSFTVV